MTRSNSFRALFLTATLALGAPLSAFAAPSNTGGAAGASEFQIARPAQVTRGSTSLAGNTGNAAQANGNPLAGKRSVSEMAAGNNDIRVGNGASAQG